MTIDSRDAFGNRAEKAAIDRTLPGIIEVLNQADEPIAAGAVMDQLAGLGLDPDDMHLAVWKGISTGEIHLTPDTLFLELPSSPSLE